MKSLFGEHANLAARVMDLRLERQNVVMSNLANIKTPGYRQRKLEFEKELQDAMREKGTMSRTNRRHMPTVMDVEGIDGNLNEKFKVHVVQGEDAVDLDKEMGIMAKNSLHYKGLETIVRRHLEGLKQVISEGGKI